VVIVNSVIWVAYTMFFFGFGLWETQKWDAAKKTMGPIVSSLFGRTSCTVYSRWIRTKVLENGDVVQKVEALGLPQYLYEGFEFAGFDVPVAQATDSFQLRLRRYQPK